MTITKTEVERAIFSAESCLHRHPLSNDLVEITEGTLAVLLEAAKCARYFNNGHNWGEAMSKSEMALDYSESKVSDVDEDERRALSDGGPADNE